jgi:hypothetical protein
MQMDTIKRGLTIHFSDGSKIRIDFPVQAPNETAALLRFEEILKQRQILAEVDGALVIVPFDNVKYIQVYGGEEFTLPRNAIRGATFRD